MASCSKLFASSPIEITGSFWVKTNILKVARSFPITRFPLASAAPRPSESLRDD